MTTEDLELATLELIKRIYCVEYCGCLEVKEIKDCICDGCCPNIEFTQTIGYELMLGLNVKDKPLRIAINGTPEQFLKYISKELRNRKLNNAQYFKGYMVDPDSQGCETQIKK